MQISVFYFVMRDSRGKEKKTGLSESFVIGVIALVFLIIGYQTAMFVHHAAVMKITAERDEPDTVYVFKTADAGGQTSADSFADLRSRDREVWRRSDGIQPILSKPRL